MSDTSRNNSEYSRSACYQQQKITTFFDKKGRVLRVESEPAEETPPAPQSIASIIDHTLLKPDATQEQVSKLCQEALQYHFGAVCVNSYWVPLCLKELAGSNVKVAATIGFPLGAMSTASKVFETREVVRQGAQEVDMVLNVGELKFGHYAEVAADVREVVRAAHRRDALVKVIIETCLLTEAEKITACLLCKQAGADFVKTSTGFSGPGATVEDVALMRGVVGPNMGVKAAGGIRTYADALKMLEAGANRIGASAGIRILQEEAEARQAQS